MKDLREIRLYPNRRLYDLSTSRYIKFSDVLNMLLYGFEVRVTETVRGKDVTHKVLTDLLLREDRTKLAGEYLLTSEFLLQLIRAGVGHDARVLQAFLDFCIRGLAPEENADCDQGSSVSAVRTGSRAEADL